MTILHRKVHLFLTALHRAIHRRGFGIQSPWAYELVRDVLFEPLHYYAYQEQNLTTSLQRQLFRIQNHYRHQPLFIITGKKQEAFAKYEEVLHAVTPDTVLIIEHIHDENAALWEMVVSDPHAIITFDMRRRGLVFFDNKRIKQNYLL